MTSTQRFNPDSPSSSDSGHENDEDLATKIRRLQTERARHVRAIDDIDKVLGQVQNVLTDLGTSDSSDGGQPRRRRYQKLETTGEESVLEFIRAQGNPTTAQVNTHWQQEGRPGVANPILARLLKRKILQRENDPGVRGSRYRINS
jgi:hypothetical protein